MQRELTLAGGCLPTIMIFVQALPTTCVVGALRVDARPLTNALLGWAARHLALFAQHLQARVVGGMTDLFAFLEASNATLDLPIETAQGLVAIEVPLFPHPACLCTGCPLPLH